MSSGLEKLDGWLGSKKGVVWATFRFYIILLSLLLVYNLDFLYLGYGFGSTIKYEF
jgi:hypothetical protein